MVFPEAMRVAIPFSSAGKTGRPVDQFSGKFPGQTALQFQVFLWEEGLVSLQAHAPIGFQFTAAIDRLAEKGKDFLRDEKARFFGPAQFILGAIEFFIPGRLAVSLAGILAGGKAEPNVGAAGDQATAADPVWPI